MRSQTLEVAAGKDAVFLRSCLKTDKRALMAELQQCVSLEQLDSTLRSFHIYDGCRRETWEEFKNSTRDEKKRELVILHIKVHEIEDSLQNIDGEPAQTVSQFFKFRELELARSQAALARDKFVWINGKDGTYFATPLKKLLTLSTIQQEMVSRGVLNGNSQERDRLAAKLGV
ncbi:hypothetical protein V490_03635 [Pseudogymnoascus sp. VKM F-3557]|nr:hypothetical protein V490_03635 [Pseudogymnoascus sp. VKM F-3557]